MPEFVRYAYRPFDTRWLYWEAGWWAIGSTSVKTISRMYSKGNLVARDSPEATPGILTTIDNVKPWAILITWIGSTSYTPNVAP